MRSRVSGRTATFSEAWGHVLKAARWIRSRVSERIATVSSGGHAHRTGTRSCSGARREVQTVMPASSYPVMLVRAAQFPRCPVPRLRSFRIKRRLTIPVRLLMNASHHRSSRAPSLAALEESSASTAQCGSLRFASDRTGWRRARVLAHSAE